MIYILDAFLVESHVYVLLMRMWKKYSTKWDNPSRKLKRHKYSLIKSKVMQVGGVISYFDIFK